MSYLTSYLEGKEISKIVAEASELLPRRFPAFDTIAVRGVSGLLVGSPLSMSLHKDLIIVRKDTESSHSTSLVEGWGCDQRILIVDDLIESGNTIDLIYESVVEKCDNPTIVGIFLYASSERQNDLKSYTHPDGTTFPICLIYRYGE